MAQTDLIQVKKISTGEIKEVPKDKFNDLNRRGHVKGYEIVQDVKKVAKEIEEKLAEKK